MSWFAPALGVANAVLYEGYLLYPYTASSRKNRVRWQFGVLVPPQFASSHPEETAQSEVSVLYERGAQPVCIDALLRFLHVQGRSVEEEAGGTFRPVESVVVDGETLLGFDGAAEREVALHVRPEEAALTVVPFEFEATRTVDERKGSDGRTRARIVEEAAALDGLLSAACEPVGDGALERLTLHVENRSMLSADGSRDAALGTSLVGAHLVLRIEGGRFLSALDPPDHARAATSALANRRLWPVLIGEAEGDEHGAALVLASPIILYDFPAIAAKTDADAFDATEIDELLQLSVLSLSDRERDEARATDPRGRAIVERAERFGREQLERLHSGTLTREDQPSAIGFDPFGDIDVPAIDCVFVNGVKVSKGSVVRLHPSRRADVWDEIVAGKTATVCAIHQDVEDQFYVAVRVDDDPANDLHEWYGRSMFFYPDEIEPLGQEVSP